MKLPTSLRRAAILVGVLLAVTPAWGQDHAVVGGIGLSNGLVGVEFVRHVEGAPFGFAIGAGLLGAGARVQRRLRETGNAEYWETRYLSAGLLLSPGGLNPNGPPATLSVEYGTELVASRRLYGSLAAGGSLALGGSYPGGILGPSLRFVIGGAF